MTLLSVRPAYASIDFPCKMYIHHQVICKLDQPQTIQLFWRLFTFFRAPGSCLGFSCRKWGSSTWSSQLHRQPPNVFTHPLLSAARNRGSLQTQFVLFRPWPGSLCLHRFNSVRGPRNGRPPSPPSLQFLTPFPCFLQLRPRSPPCLVTSLFSCPGLKHTSEGKGAHAPILNAKLGLLREGPVVASSSPPGVCKLFTFISRLQRQRDLASAQAHPVSSKKATAFLSPRRPCKQ